MRSHHCTREAIPTSPMLLHARNSSTRLESKVRARPISLSPEGPRPQHVRSREQRPWQRGRQDPKCEAPEGPMSLNERSSEMRFWKIVDEIPRLQTPFAPIWLLRKRKVCRWGTGVHGMLQAASCLSSFMLFASCAQAESFTSTPAQSRTQGPDHPHCIARQTAFKSSLPCPGCGT